MDLKQTRVLVVDDSSFQREALGAILSSDASIHVVGYACNGREAVEKAISSKPDVITMDIQMPVMNGFLAIEEIMKKAPCPIIVTSAFDSETLGKALSIGAMDYVTVGRDLAEIADDLINKVKIAARVKPIRRMNLQTEESGPVCTLGAKESCRVIAIGVSTGGPSALMDLFSTLPIDFPAPILVAQHMLPGFTEGLVEHLQTKCPFDVQVAKDGQRLMRSTAYVAPDHHHMRIGIDRSIELVHQSDLTHSYVPSIDCLLESVAWTFHENAVGVLLTGMGEDGVKGIEAIKRARGTTIAQDETSSVVFGMNRVAIERHLIQSVVPMAEMSSHLVQVCLAEDIKSKGYASMGGKR